MNDSARQKLIELVRRHGTSIAADARRAEGLFRDNFGEFRREIAVLTMALEENVAADLINAAGQNAPRASLLARLTQRLVDNLALSEDAARWAVNSWALALGAVSEADLKTLEKPTLETAENVVAASQNQTVPQNQSSPVQTQNAAKNALIVSANGGGDFVSIAEAVKAAADNWQILVRPGLYEESLILNKSVNIVGDGAANEVVIKSRAASCVAMRAERAAIRNVTLQCSADADFFAVDINRGELLLENCDVSSSARACVAVGGENANVLLRGCSIHDGADAGIRFFDSASGTIEECQIYRNKRAGVVIAENANPTFKKCRIFAGENVGFLVHQSGLGTIDDCEIFGNGGFGVAVSRGGSPVLRGCSVYQSNNSGINVVEAGQALLEDCAVYENAGAGIAVDGASIVAVQSSRVVKNGTAGVSVRGGSSVRVETSDLRGNRLSSWEIELGAWVENNNNLED